MDSFSQLPEIGQHFYNAYVERVHFGPRQEFSIDVRRLIWEGHNGHYDKRVIHVRFGGVANLRAVTDFFAKKPHERSELLEIDYAKSHTSKIGHLFVEISFERIEAKIVVECQNIAISHDEPKET